MIKKLLCLPFFLISLMGMSQENDPDSLTDEKAVVLTSNKKLGVSQITYTRKQLLLLNQGADLPILLNMAPGVVSFSDAGNSVGYTGLRIRGTDASRILVTVNGVPINDAESQSVFWVNMPDILSSAEAVQVQRGVGATSTGVPTFGGGVHLTTLSPSKKAWGIYNSGMAYLLPEPTNYRAAEKVHRFTQKHSLGFGTGYLPGGWSLDGRFSIIKSDGAINNSASDLKSYYLQMARDIGKHKFRIIHFSGSERTGQAWNGVPFDTLYGKTKNRVYNEFSYIGQTDNYKQHHLQILYTWQYSPRLLWNVTAHGTDGSGYFEEFKKNEPATKYNLTLDSFSGSRNTDLIRRRWLDNIYAGIISNVQYQSSKYIWTAGISANQYYGNHFGEVIWASIYGNQNYPQKYYTGNSVKSEWNLFFKQQETGIKKSKFYWEIQARNIYYNLSGTDDNSGPIISYNLKKSYHFIMPRIGYTTEFNKHYRQSVFIGLASREPVRSDLIVSGKSIPKPEHLFNVEYNLQYIYKDWQWNQTLYFMGYRDQLVNDGRINDVGAYQRINLDKSYRMGWEGQCKFTGIKNWLVDANVGLSANRALSFTEFADIFTDSTYENVPIQTYKNTPLSFSPSLTMALNLRYNVRKNVWAEVLIKHVSRQYLDNTGRHDRSLKPFTVADLRLGWSIHSTWMITGWVQNVLNTLYAPNGYTYGYVYQGERSQFNVAYPMSGTQIWLQLSAGF